MIMHVMELKGSVIADLKDLFIDHTDQLETLCKQINRHFILFFFMKIVKGN